MRPEVMFFGFEICSAGLDFPINMMLTMTNHGLITIVTAIVTVIVIVMFRIPGLSQNHSQSHRFMITFHIHKSKSKSKGLAGIESILQRVRVIE